MTKEVLKRLQRWCSVNNLFFDWKITDVDNEIYNIGEKKFFVVLPVKGKVVNKLGGLNLTDEQLENIGKGEGFDYFAFEFGQRWYYCEKKVAVDEFNDEYYEANFNDLKYVGKAVIDLDMEFCMLGIHTEYELLNGSHKSDYWVKKAKFLGQKKIALCDKDTLAGTLAFQLACKKGGIDSILGMTATVKRGNDIYEIKMFTANEKGWQNLLAINREINVENEGYIEEHRLIECADGLVAVLGVNSVIHQVPLQDAIVIVDTFRGYFEDIYYEIDPVTFYDETDDVGHLSKIQFYFKNFLTGENKIKPILVPNAYYLDTEMFNLKEMLNRVGKRAQRYSEDQHYKTLDECYLQLEKLFSNKDDFDKFFLRVVRNTVSIGKQCCFEINTGQHKLPRYKFLDGKTNEELFWELIEKGLNKKVVDPTYVWEGKNIDTYVARIEKECRVIIGAGFIDYFLILWDIVEWAKRTGIVVGTGRGSVGGCLVAYLLDITDTDPVRFDLLFERFLNETRVSGERAKAADAMPDIDLDFQSERRDDVKAYIFERFGKFHTCSIGAFGRLKLKGAIKDFGREKGLNFEYLNAITKDIDDEIEYTFKDFIKYALQSKQLYDFIQKNFEIVNLLKHSMGQTKIASVHASAVIIVPEEDFNGNKVDIFNWLPIRKIDGKLISEWEGKSTDRAGFLKEDILGLSQLDKFKRITDLIKINYGKKIRIPRIPLEDDNVFRLFKKGLNEDVFQFTSGGLKSYSKEAKPDNIEDLTAMTSLYRPGPMDSGAHKDFALIKHGKKKPKYDYGLREVTEKTFGLFIYQEQIMKSVVVLGGLSLVESDEVRTVIKKFDKVKMDTFEKKFIAGAIERKCPPDEAAKIWAKLLAFSGYGFNRSHALAYSLISYYAMWFKVNYPLEFWTASLQYAKDHHIPNRISEIRKLKQGIDVKPPDINNSNLGFECNVENQTIYWSLEKIKNVGSIAVGYVMAERKRGKFKSYEDFIVRMPKKNINKRTVFCLLMAGAFDEIEGIEAPVQRYHLLKKHCARLKEPLSEEFQNFDEVKKSIFWITRQKELTGFGDVNYKEILIDAGYKKMASRYMTYDQLAKCAEYDYVTVAGKVNFMKERTTKKGIKKTFLTMEILCNNDMIPVVLWSETYEAYKELLTNSLNKTFAFTGKVRYDNYRGCNGINSVDETIIKLL